MPQRRLRAVACKYREPGRTCDLAAAVPGFESVGTATPISYICGFPSGTAAGWRKYGDADESHLSVLLSCRMCRRFRQYRRALRVRLEVFGLEADRGFDRAQHDRSSISFWIPIRFAARDLPKIGNRQARRSPQMQYRPKIPLPIPIDSRPRSERDRLCESQARRNS